LEWLVKDKEVEMALQTATKAAKKVTGLWGTR
jgi:hypothetical protein